jgi:hypothetical protein
MSKKFISQFITRDPSQKPLLERKNSIRGFLRLKTANNARSRRIFLADARDIVGPGDIEQLACRQLLRPRWIDALEGDFADVDLPLPLAKG